MCGLPCCVRIAVLLLRPFFAPATPGLPCPARLRLFLRLAFDHEVRISWHPKSRSLSLRSDWGSRRGGWGFVLRVLVLRLRLFLAPLHRRSSAFALARVALERLSCCVTPTNQRPRHTRVMSGAKRLWVASIAQRVDCMFTLRLNHLRSPPAPPFALSPLVEPRHAPSVPRDVAM